VDCGSQTTRACLIRIISGVWGPTKGGAPPRILGGLIGTQFKERKVVDGRIKRGVEGEKDMCSHLVRLSR
jgi:hypothetical protein